MKSHTLTFQKSLVSGRSHIKSSPDTPTLPSGSCNDGKCSRCTGNKPAKTSNVHSQAPWNDLMGEEETCFSLLTGFSKFCFVDIPKISFRFVQTCIRNPANIWRFAERSLDNKSAAHCFSQLAALSSVHFFYYYFIFFFYIKSHLFCTLLLFTFFASRTPSPLVFPLCFLICVIPSCSHHASPATPPHLHLPSFCTIYLALTASCLARLITDSPSLSTSPPALPPPPPCLPLPPSPLLPLFPGED